MNFISFAFKTVFGILTTFVGIALAATMYWWGDVFSFNSSAFLYGLSALFAFSGVYIVVCAEREYRDYEDDCDRLVDYQ